MKKKLLAGFLFLLLLLLSGCQVPVTPKREGTVRVVTSFYPLYIAAANLLDGVDGVELINLTQPSAGCLHDYQLSPQELMQLESADVLVVNGAGMESFLQKVLDSYPNLPIVMASDGQELLEDAAAHEGHDHEHDHSHEGDEEDIAYNPHVWVSISRYMEEVKTMEKGIAAVAPAYARQIGQNADAYMHTLTDLKERMHQSVDALPNRDIITFHEAFGYFAEEFHLNVVAVVEREPGTDPTPRELVGIVDTVEQTGCKALFAEPQYSGSMADTISRETGAGVYLLDPVVTGELQKDAYVKAMEQNLQALKEALG